VSPTAPRAERAPPEGCRVIVMAKAPRPGLAKTRLIPALGAEGAAALAARLLRHAVRQAREAGLGLVELCGAPRADDPAFSVVDAGDVDLRSDQGDGDLGGRMARALDRALADGRPALLIGTDLPALDATVLRGAAAALAAGDDAVFVPALDGGYGLVGLRRPAPALFQDMRWSHPGVMAETRRRAAAAGLRWRELPALHDIDEPADLAQLPPGWLEAVAAATAAAGPTPHPSEGAPTPVTP